MTDLCTVYVTTSTLDEATRIADALLQERLIACANLLPSMTSMYRWNDRVDVGSEVAMLLKTQQSLVDQVTQRVQSLHSHEVPCIVTWPIASGSDAYLSWVRSETQTPR